MMFAQERQLVMFLLCCCCLMAWCLTEAAAAAASPQEVRVMSFNIRYASIFDGLNVWDLRADFVTQEIQMFAPDVIGFQEVLLEQRLYLQDELGEIYDLVGVGRDDGQEAGEQVTIAYSKQRFTLKQSGYFWLSETPDVPSLGWDATCCARITTWVLLVDSETTVEFVVVNTHLDHEGSQARIESAKLIKSFLNTTFSAETPVILTGDFNIFPDTSMPYQELVLPEGDPFVDTYRVLQPEPLPFPLERTFHNFMGPNCTFCNPFRIDWILVTEHFITKNATIEVNTFGDDDDDDGTSRYSSDHFPVTAVFEFNANRTVFNTNAPSNAPTGSPTTTTTTTSATTTSVPTIYFESDDDDSGGSLPPRMSACFLTLFVVLQILGEQRRSCRK